MFKFAFNNLWKKRSRSMLALIGLSIAIVGVVGLISISDGLRYNINQVLSKMEGVTVMQKGSMDDTFSSVSLDDAKRIEQLQGVKVVVPLISGIASNVEKKGGSITASPMGGMVMLIGLDPSKSRLLKEGSLYNPKIAKGRPLSQNDRYSVVMGAKIAERYKKSVGSSFFFNDHDFKIVGIFESGSTLVDNVVAIPFDTAQEIYSKPKDRASSLYVEPTDVKDASALASRINLMFPDKLDAKTASQSSGQFNTIFTMMDTFFMVVSSVAVIIGAIGILNTMLMSVMERTREFGILRAVGWTAEDVMKLIVFESFFLGIIGGLLGCALGFVAVQALGAILMFHPLATPTLLITAFMLAIFLGVMGGLYPAWKASRQDPITSIRYAG
jgi:putative ABC transport system permease protein